MSTIAGTWLSRMKTPVGAIETDYRFEDEDGVIRGSASGGETTTLTDIAVEDGPDEQRVSGERIGA